MEDREREGRDIILYYLIESLKEFFAINPDLVANGFVKLLKRKLPEYSKQFTGEVIDPEDFKGMEDLEKAMGLMQMALTKRNLCGEMKVERPTPTTLDATITGCSYKDFAKLCVEAGHKGCLFCPIVFSGQPISAILGIHSKKREFTFDIATETCTMATESSSPE